MSIKLLIPILLCAFAKASVCATVYDKDGSTLSIGGYVKASMYSANDVVHKKSHDAMLVNSSRLNILAKGKIADDLYAGVFAEWNMANGNGKNGEKIRARDQYLGFQSSSYGTFTFGRMTDGTNNVLSATGVFDDFGSMYRGETSGDRRNGTFKYVYDKDYIFGVSFVTSSDDAPVAGEKTSIKYGYSVALGYTFKDVLWDDLTVIFGYAHIKGKSGSNSLKYGDDGDPYRLSLDVFDHANASVSIGRKTQGWYGAFSYDYFRNLCTYEHSYSKNTYDFIPFGTRFTSMGYDLVGMYTFDNGLQMALGYNQTFWIANAHEIGGSLNVREDLKVRKLTFNINYTYKNFYTWCEISADVGSEKDKVIEMEVQTNTESTISGGVKYVF